MTIADRISTKVKKIVTRGKNAKVSTRATRNGLANRDRRRDAEVRSARQGKFYDAVLDFIEDQDARIAELAASLEVNFKYLRGIVLRMGGHIKISRKSNRHNAMKYVRHMKVDPELDPDEQARINDLIVVAKEASSSKVIPEHQMMQMITLLDEKKRREREGSRLVKKKWRTKSVNKTHERVSLELEALDAREDTASIAITVRTDPTHTNVPLYYAHPKLEQFITQVIGMSMNDFAFNMECFSMFSLQGLTKNANDRKSAAKSAVIAQVKEGLIKITGDKDARMEWERYHEKIVLKRRVRLVGWPFKSFSPQVLGIKDLDIALKALTSDPPTCFWQPMTPEQVEAATQKRNEEVETGAVVEKTRKERADKGKKRGAYTKKRAVEDAEKSAPARKKRVVTRSGQKKAVAVESDAEDGSDSSDDSSGSDSSASSSSSDDDDDDDDE
ncbi:hypothetical protein SISSUDRAFT_1067654 [Sistotremastrum suecicum HHB10207 ss-3]|uniref:Uncharacterized protein n=1 Tax=Sistotremastrum suecicum HHB10207 ss-3 TaxID=1314776 RepID=A0A165WVT1_9AGAM|nr:hypothetical protein SISSUDRAFT_1067654 [Sistotremastrum suecicum HHB10207 ss-3]